MKKLVFAIAAVIFTAIVSVHCCAYDMTDKEIYKAAQKYITSEEGQKRTAECISETLEEHHFRHSYTELSISKPFSLPYLNIRSYYYRTDRFSDDYHFDSFYPACHFLVYDGEDIVGILKLCYNVYGSDSRLLEFPGPWDSKNADMIYIPLPENIGNDKRNTILFDCACAQDSRKHGDKTLTGCLCYDMAVTMKNGEPQILFYQYDSLFFDTFVDDREDRTQVYGEYGFHVPEFSEEDLKFFKRFKKFKMPGSDDILFTVKVGSLDLPSGTYMLHGSDNKYLTYKEGKFTTEDKSGTTEQIFCISENNGRFFLIPASDRRKRIDVDITSIVNMYDGYRLTDKKGRELALTDKGALVFTTGCNDEKAVWCLERKD
ncbi:MAG: hypothetical protein ILP19_06100 [Oscillospiraceae bacterium]|nr:hypothetical protein [Oscillospiraceae bacterium]